MNSWLGNKRECKMRRKQARRARMIYIVDCNRYLRGNDYNNKILIITLKDVVSWDILEMRRMNAGGRARRHMIYKWGTRCLERGSVPNTALQNPIVSLGGPPLIFIFFPLFSLTVKSFRHLDWLSTPLLIGKCACGREALDRSKVEQKVGCTEFMCLMAKI